ncbi:MAG: hypothetical protein KDB22_10825 [Planctomycetales bacterium]|nr:hypothetical protein [Planctomycetales bacterium]
MPNSTEFAGLIFGARDWIVVASSLAAIVVVLALWSYLNVGKLTGSKIAAMLCKLAAILALAFCLLEPMQRVERPRPGANVMAIVVDNSKSMQIRPPGEGKSRIERFQPVLPTETQWQARLAQDFDVRRYQFDDSLRAVESFSDVRADGNGSSIADTLSTIRDRFAARPVAGMMLLSDGIATDALESFLAEESPSFPIYPVIYGQEENFRDISILDVAVSMSSFELAPASLEATIDCQGLAGRDIVVRLFDAKGKTLESMTIAGTGGESLRRARMQFRPSDVGTQFVRLRAMLATEDSEQIEAQSTTEVTTVNNSRLLAVDRGGGPFKILYIAGRPNWEFKFLRRALEEDVELELSAIVRIAKKEPKFSFRDRGVETVNPLIAGFSDDEETAEQYDEPVLLTLGEESEQLKSGFPSGEDELFAYHAIVLDDIEASFFSQQQMLLMREFVSSRGGGIMMLGGAESFADGKYQETPLADILPIYLTGNARRQPSVDREQSVRYQLTREGNLEPWLRLRANESDESTRAGQMPSFLTWNQVSDVKPGASVYAHLESGEAELPGLVGQRFGRGRSLALLVGDFWRWSMRRAADDTDDLAQSWRQIARWLTNDAPRRVELAVTAPESTKQPHRLQIQVRNAAYKPLDNASVDITVVQPDQTEVVLKATPDASRPGFYNAEYFCQSDGGYLCRIECTGPDGETLEPRVSGWTAQPSSIEFNRVHTERRLLEQLAQKSGGEVVPIENLDRFVSTLPFRRVPITESRFEPIWHQPWLVLFALGCLCIEWGMRRWKGLP